MNSILKFLLHDRALAGSQVLRHPARFALNQYRTMSKYLSKSAAKRLPLTTKRANKNFYKGKGCTKEGRITSKGKFIVNRLKRLELIVPDLTGFKLKPYIARTASKYAPENRRGPMG